MCIMMHYGIYASELMLYRQNPHKRAVRQYTNFVTFSTCGREGHENEHGLRTEGAVRRVGENAVGNYQPILQCTVSREDSCKTRVCGLLANLKLHLCRIVANIPEILPACVEQFLLIIHFASQLEALLWLKVAR